MYYPMRVAMNREYKLIWNIAWRLDYPFASDLWDSPTYQGVIKRGLKQYGKRSIDNYLYRPEFELYNIAEDPDEINNLASDKKYESVLNDMKQKIKDFQLRTRDPWIIKWSNENVFGGSGVNL
jgi:N-sulfoglucosamine sulfohydrolase